MFSWFPLLAGSGFLGPPKPLYGEGGSRTSGAAGATQTSSATDGYVGAQTCASCHRQVHDTWTAGRHSKMIQPATAATVKGDFSQSGATLQGRRYGFRTANGQFFITESELVGRPQEHRVEYTLGSRRIQHYLTTIEKGRMIVLAPSWDVQRKAWFHNVEIIRPDEDDRQIVQQWNKSCVGCHVSRQDNAYDPATRAYRTEWMDFGTSCERCHGPGRAHVEQYQRSTQNAQNTQTKQVSAGSSSSPLIVRPTRLDSNTSSMVCAQCHSLRTAINPDYKAGDDYYDYFAPALEYAPHARPHASQDPPYWADGRPRRFSNDAIGLWQSACFLRGGATCTTCHTNPHLPDIDRNPQLAPASSNALCTKCHKEIGERLTAHTRHRADSAGSSCVECHMPKTVVSIKSTMRDHTIGVPAPENTARFNIPNACTECHADQPAAWAADTLTAWWPQGRRSRLVAQAEAFTGARAGRADALVGLLAIADDPQRAPLVRANAIGYLGRFADPRAVSAIVRGTKSPHPAIRAIAMGALRETGRRDSAARSAVLGALTDSRRAVRIAALLTLVGQGDVSGIDAQHFRRVAHEFANWTAANRDSAELQRYEGIVHILGQDFDRAAASLEISLDLDAASPSAKFFLALARIGQRRFEEARTLLRQIPPDDSDYRRAQAQLEKLR